MSNIVPLCPSYCHPTDLSHAKEPSYKIQLVYVRYYDEYFDYKNPMIFEIMLQLLIVALLVHSEFNTVLVCNIYYNILLVKWSCAEGH